MEDEGAGDFKAEFYKRKETQKEYGKLEKISGMSVIRRQLSRQPIQIRERFGCPWQTAALAFKNCISDSPHRFVGVVGERHAS